MDTTLKRTANKLSTPTCLGGMELINNTVHSAMSEGMADSKGFPTKAYKEWYEGIKNTGVIITSPAAVNPAGQAVTANQVSMDSMEKILAFKQTTAAAHQNSSRIFLQITGSLGVHHPVTLAKPTTAPQLLHDLSAIEVYAQVKNFARAAHWAKSAGFDGVQLHAAGGSLIQQFLLQTTNQRTDTFGIHKPHTVGTKFLELIMDNIHKLCGRNFPILVKVLAPSDPGAHMTARMLKEFVLFLQKKGAAGLEISGSPASLKKYLSWVKDRTTIPIITAGKIR